MEINENAIEGNEENTIEIESIASEEIIEKVKPIQKNNPIFERQLITEITINDLYTRINASKYIDDETSKELKPIAKISTERFFELFNSGAQDLTPKNCRLFNKTSQGYKTFIFEEAPSLRTVSIEMDLEHEKEFLQSRNLYDEYGCKEYFEEHKKRPYRMQLAFPYMIFIINFDNYDCFKGLKVYYRVHPLKSLDDYLLTTNLLNVSTDGSVCIGEMTESVNRMSLNERAELILSMFWNNEFNNDIISSYQLYEKIPEVYYFMMWRHFSKVDPLFIFSVNWNKSNTTLKSELQHYQTRSNSFNQLYDLISRNNTTGYSREYEHSQTIAIYNNSSSKTPNIYLSIGDEFILDDKKKYYIEEIYVENSCYYFITEDEDGDLKSFKVTNTFKNEIVKNWKEDDKLTILDKNGNVVSEGSVLKLFKIDTETYIIRQVNKIRKTRDNKIEISCGKSFFYASKDFSDTIELFDMENIELDGVKLKQGNKYYLLKDNSYFLKRILEVTFSHIDFLDNDKINFIFKITNGSTITINQNGEYKIIENLETFDVLRIGNELICRREGLTLAKLQNGFGILSNSNTYPPESIMRLSLTPEEKKFILDNILRDDTLKIDSFNLDISFSVGDNVVFYHGNLPLEEMIKVRTIKSFTYLDDVLWIDTVDENNNISSFPYINFNTTKPFILVGSVRKITLGEGIFEKGTKIKSLETSIPLFPKKDTYEVVGIITDGGIAPVILCSNGHTIWADEDNLKRFKFITKSDKKFSSLKTTKLSQVPFKIQPGDMILDGKYFKLVNNYYKCLETISLQRLGSLYGINNYGFYSTIPLPRLGKRDNLNYKIYYVAPNYHGGFTEVINYFGVPFSLFIDERARSKK